MPSTEGKELNEKLEQLISKAIKKIEGDKENDICRYLPVSTGGYIHHFTMRKMKTEDPVKLCEMIEEHIINANNKPKPVAPKPRAARGSRKMRGNFFFTKHDMDRLLNMARLAGDKELVKKLTPKEDLRTTKRKLISSIKHGRIEPELWEAYVEAQTNHSQVVTSHTSYHAQMVASGK